MIAKNPLAANFDRPAYELPDLFRTLGETSVFAPLTENQRHAADAIKTHAANAQEVILEGIASIGHLMTTVGDDMEVDNGDLLCLGGLLKHLALEAERLRCAHADMRSILKSDNELRASPNPVKAAADRKVAASKGAKP